MGGKYRTRVIPPMMSLGERVARQTGVFQDAGTGWDIPFRIYYSGNWFSGYFIANSLRLMVGVPGMFLVYWEDRFRGTLSWTAKGWIMPMIHDLDLIAALGEWIELFYE